MKRFLAVFIVAALFLAVFPAAAFAEGEATNLRFADGRSWVSGSSIDVKTIMPGTDVTFDAAAVNDSGAPIIYQWAKSTDGITFENIDGETAATYTVDAQNLTAAKLYCCNITDGTETLLYRVQLDAGIRITGSSGDVVGVDINSAGTPVSLFVDAESNFSTDGLPLTYQWYYEGEAITGATSPSYTISAISNDNTGFYYCDIYDGFSFMPLSYETNVFFETGLQWEEDLFSNLLGKTSVKEGEPFSATVKAVSSQPNISYRWEVWNEELGDYEILSSTDTFTIDAVTSEHYGKYFYCTADDGYNTITDSFLLSPYTGIEIALDEFIVVEGETLKIAGTAKTPKIEGVTPEYGNPEVALAKYDRWRDNYGIWHEGGIDDWWLATEIGGTGTDWSGVLDGKGSAGATYSETDTEYITDFWITLSDISDVWEGKFSLGATDYYGGLTKIDFNITIGEYGQIVLESENGVSIEGVIHPGAKLNMRPLQNHVRNYFEKHMPEGAEIIWGNDVTLEIYGIADKHKGDLKLNIPVNKKYNGMKLTVLHYTDGGIEELAGYVKDGILSVTTEGLSPFAVIYDSSAAKTLGPLDNVPDMGEREPDYLLPLALLLVGGSVFIFGRLYASRHRS